MRPRNETIANRFAKLLDDLNECLKNGGAELLQNDRQTKNILLTMLLEHGVDVRQSQPKRLKANQRELKRAKLAMKGELLPLLESAV
jgi:hypothetical protein